MALFLINYKGIQYAPSKNVHLSEMIVFPVAENTIYVVRSGYILRVSAISLIVHFTDIFMIRIISHTFKICLTRENY